MLRASICACLFPAAAGALLGMVGDDHPTVSQLEFGAWYLFAAATNPYNVGLLDFWPIVLANQGKEVARQEKCGEWFPSTPEGERIETSDCGCVGKDGTSTVGTEWCECLCMESNWRDPDGELIVANNQVSFLGVTRVTYQTIWPSAMFVTSWMQLFFAVFGAAIADFGAGRKWIMVVSTILASACVVASGVLSGSNTYPILWANMVFGFMSKFMLGVAGTMHGAYGPILADASPDVRAAVDADGDDHATIEKVRERVQVRMSSIKATLGDSTSVLFLIVALISIAVFDAPLTFVTLICGVWMLIVGTIAVVGIKTRPGRDVPEGNCAVAKISVTSTYQTFQTLQHLRQLGIWLLAFFLYSDGQATALNQVSTLASTELGASDDLLMLVFLTLSVSSVPGTLLFWRWQAQYDWSLVNLYIFSLFAEGLILPLAALWVYQEWQMFLVAAVAGFCEGPRMAFGNTIWVSMLPRGREVQYMAFRQVVDKGTAFLGPLWLSYWANNGWTYRNAFAGLILFYIIGGPVLFWFDLDRAVDERLAFERMDKYTGHGTRNTLTATFELTRRASKVSEATQMSTVMF